MIDLNKKTILILLVVIIVVAGAAAAAVTLKKPDEKPKAKEPVEVTKTAPAQSGWISSPDSSEGGATEATITAATGGYELVALQVNITIKDDDGSHSETDDGSEPDKVSVTVGDDTFEVATEMGSGEGSIMKEYGKSDVAGFNDTIEVRLMGMEFGGGKNPTGPIGIIPIPFLVYIDQGCAYNVEITFTYLDTGVKPKKEEPKKDSGDDKQSEDVLHKILQTEKY